MLKINNIYKAIQFKRPYNHDTAATLLISFPILECNYGG